MAANAWRDFINFILGNISFTDMICAAFAQSGWRQIKISGKFLCPSRHTPRFEHPVKIEKWSETGQPFRRVSDPNEADANLRLTEKVRATDQ